MSVNSKAVITLQVGHYANFVGAHFWNAQELAFQVDKEKNDLDHDVLFREGVTTSKQVTYTPRLISLDLKGALGSLPEFGDLYHDIASGSVVAKTDLTAQAEQNWHSKVEVERAETHRKTRFLRNLEASEGGNERIDVEKDIDIQEENQVPRFTDCSQLDGEVNLWSDYLMTRYHPKTNVVISEFGHANPNDPFDIFGIGTNAWSASELSDIFEDRLRFFAEEVDFLKGFQLIHDATDAFGGISSMISEFIRDEYGSQCLLAFPTLPTHYNGEGNMDGIKSTTKMLNLALTLRSISEFSSLITPLSLASETFPLRGLGSRQVPSLNYKSDLHYHTSSVLALGLDALTLPWRSLNGPYASPFDVSCGLGTYGRKLANFGLVAPFPKPWQDKLSGFLGSYSLKEAFSLSPHVLTENFESVWCQSVSSRGILGSEVEHLDFLGYFDRIMPRTATAVTTSRSPIQIGAPFPSHMVDSPYWDTSSKTLPLLSLWQSCRDSGKMASILAERSKRINLNKLHRFQDAGLDEDSLKESIEDLYKLSDCYVEPTDAI